ncbi:sodium-dependent transporter [Pseudovibrio exalbescens]|uniref:sodium-dependent transporter n=1 Tax=Pseudovibrio exalbescens TaxID=197461 RepID=UPI000C9A9B25|nr:sodium-dependent transporter [Pseudovibrio exalbescens]
MQREHWGSRFGFIMAAAGSAVGLGNIWKFPYLAGSEGGGAFLIIYLAMVATIGFSAMIAEISIGRHAQLDPIGAFRKTAGGGWTLFGVLAILTPFVILSFYSVVGGWTIAYIVKSVQLMAGTVSEAGHADQFGQLVSSPAEPIVYHAIFMGLTMLIVLKGITGGIEQASKVLMPVLFVLLLVLVGRALTLPGAMKGVEFLLAPDFSKVNGSMISAALGQAFFSLSLGMGALITYGSYVNPDANIRSSAGWILSLDTLVAVLAGLIIMPAVFAFGMDPGAGPGLTFITLPAVFEAMPAGAFFQTIFFVMLTIAAITSSISLLNIPVAWLCDEKGMSRSTATITVGVVTFALGVPSSLAMGVWGDVHFFGMNFFDLLSYLTDTYALPLGGIGSCLVAGWVAYDKMSLEVTNNGSAPFALLTVWKWICRVVAPLAILWIMANMTIWA